MDSFDHNRNILRQYFKGGKYFESWYCRIFVPLFDTDDKHQYYLVSQQHGGNPSDNIYIYIHIMLELECYWKQ